jgi:hypothetical protein
MNDGCISAGKYRKQLARTENIRQLRAKRLLGMSRGRRKDKEQRCEIKSTQGEPRQTRTSIFKIVD